MMKVDIALATYNGAAYLREQLESILAQDYKDWRLFIRDDGSTDGTLAILDEYAAKHPEKIRLLPGDNKKPLGINGNFSALLAATSAPYVMCADQDDTWYPNKISLTLSGLQELEREQGSTVPLLVHTDVTVTNEVLEVVYPSRMKHYRVQPEQSSLSRLLIQNTVQGCTMMMNRALLSAALPIPQGVRIYDMWLAQVAAALGDIGYIDRSTMSYRQHKSNVIGARKKTVREQVGTLQAGMDANVTQAILLADKVKDAVSEPVRELLQVFCKIHDKGFFEKRRIMIENRILRFPAWQNVPLLLMM